MLLLTEQHCHQSEEARVLASEEKTMVSMRKHELTVVDSVYVWAYYWLEMGKRGRIMQMTATWRINILLVLTTISGLPLFGHNVEVTA